MTGGYVTVLKEEDKLARWSHEWPDRSRASGQVLGHAGMDHAWVRGWSWKAVDDMCCLLGFWEPLHLVYTVEKVKNVVKYLR